MTLFGLDGPVDDDGLMQWMRANELACHLPMVLQKVDRASMHHSLEVRVPLLDLEVVETAVRVDPDSALRGTLGKVPLRRALAERVDPTLIPVAKKGFSVPLRDWLRGDLEPWARDLLGGDLFPSGAFASAAVSVWYDDHVDGHLDRTRGLWNLLSLQAWARTHLVPLPRGGSA